MAVSNVIIQNAYGFVQKKDNNSDNNNRGGCFLKKNGCQGLYKHCKSHTEH